MKFTVICSLNCATNKKKLKSLIFGLFERFGVFITWNTWVFQTTFSAAVATHGLTS